MRAKGSLARAGTLVHDTVTRDATLRDALEAVLTDNAGRVAVTGRRGEYIGVVDMETLMNSVHELLEADRLEAMEHQHELEEARAQQTQPEQEGVDGGEREGVNTPKPPAGSAPRASTRSQGVAFRDDGRGASRTAAEPPPPVPPRSAGSPGRS